MDGKSYLSKIIDFYKDEYHTIRKTDSEIYSELEQTHKDLEKWVNDLPIISEEI